MASPFASSPPPIRNSPRPVAIVGAGGHGRVVLDILRLLPQYRVIGFIDSNPNLLNQRIDGVPVLGNLSVLAELKNRTAGLAAIVAIGTNGIRRTFAEEIEARGIDLINAIHPTANIANNATLGKNIVVAAGALACAHCQIGDSAILNTGAIVDHESTIGPSAHICPGARLAGQVTVASGAFVGIGATVIQNIRIGHDAIVGAGAVVIQDVGPLTTVVGVPARVVKDLSSREEFSQWLAPEFLRRQPPQRRSPANQPPTVADPITADPAIQSSASRPR